MVSIVRGALVKRAPTLTREATRNMSGLPILECELRTLRVVPNAFAERAERYRMAAAGTVGVAVMTFEKLAARLAGGFLHVAGNRDAADALVRAVDGPLGELSEIAAFPGFRRAAAASISKAWLAGISLRQGAHDAAPDSPAARRFAALGMLEQRLLAELPSNIQAPPSIAAAACLRVEHAKRIFGRIEIHAHTELHPVWRPLLAALAKTTDVRWLAGPTHIPPWLAATDVRIETAPAQSPQQRAEICADPRHEMLEAVRWARALIVDQGIAPGDIAIAAATPQAWDEHLGALRLATDVPIYSAHGERALRTAAGQTAAALAELVLHGVSRSRLLRFIELQAPWHDGMGDFGQSVFAESPLLDVAQVHAALDAWENRTGTVTIANSPHAANYAYLRRLARGLEMGVADAAGLGDVLPPRAQLLWERALLDGPAPALPITLAELVAAEPQATSPEHAVLWCSAAVLASQPRPYVRLIGLISRAWPRSASEDPLLPGHIIEQSRLNPLPVHLADRRDFASIVAKAASLVVYSRARRNSDGRLNGISPLWPQNCNAIELSALRAAPHAASPADRAFLRPAEFGKTVLAESAQAAWQNWRKAELTPHDGQMPASHPLLVRALDRVQSATSLQLLVTNPLGYVWRYGFRWNLDEELEEPFTLDPRLFGTFVHEILDTAQRRGGADKVSAAVAEVAKAWEQHHPLPPPFIWRATLVQAQKLAVAALAADDGEIYEQSWSEIPFGRSGGTEIPDAAPWDCAQAVAISGTGIRIAGRIDRLELSADGRRARVTDYKTAKTQPGSDIVVAGGQELQRCIYAYAVHALLPEITEIRSRLLYPVAAQREKQVYELPNPSDTLAQVSEFLRAAHDLLQSGAALPAVHGIDPTKFAARAENFALPAGAQFTYLARKAEAVCERLAPLVPLWNMK